METTATDLVLVTYEALRGEGWSEALAEEVAGLVTEALGAERLQRLAGLLAEGPKGA